MPASSTKELDNKFKQLVEFNNEYNQKRIDKIIESLKITKNVIEKLDYSDIIYVHVKLHLLAHQKRNKSVSDKIKLKHDLLIPYMHTHLWADFLDD